MTEYRYEFVFGDIDDNMNTQGRGIVKMDIVADDLRTANLIAERIQHVLGADTFQWV